MTETPVRSALITLALFFAASASAQTTQSQNQNQYQDPDLPSLLADYPGVPGVPGLSSRLRHFNAGFTFTSVHDSASGWYTLATPAVAYTFSPHYSLDLSFPIYLYRLAENETTKDISGTSYPESTRRLFIHDFDPGDLFLAAHATYTFHHVTDIITPSMTLPSGDASDGLSTGRVTFDFDNHLETPMPHSESTFILAIGGGDSSSLVNRLVTQDYTSLGPLAHFQIGLRTPLPHGALFQSIAYEQLPLGDNKVYATLTRPGFPNNVIVTGHSASEDNGFTSSLAIPLTSQLTLQGYYNRSLRLHLDTVGMGISFVLRGRKKHRSSLYDELLR